MPASCAGCGVARDRHVARTATERDTGSQEERDKSIATPAKSAAENSALKKLRSVMLSDLQEILLGGRVVLQSTLSHHSAHTVVFPLGFVAGVDGFLNRIVDNPFSHNSARVVMEILYHIDLRTSLIYLSPTAYVSLRL